MTSNNFQENYNDQPILPRLTGHGMQPPLSRLALSVSPPPSVRLDEVDIEEVLEGCSLMIWPGWLDEVRAAGGYVIIDWVDMMVVVEMEECIYISHLY